MSSNPFVAPAIDTKKPFEPPEFSVIRDLLSRKFIEMEMNPFGVAGANTGGGLPLPPSWSPYGVGGGAQGTPGGMWNAMTGTYGGPTTAPAGMPPPNAAPAPPPSVLPGATPQESPQTLHDGEGRPWYDDGSHGPQAPGVQKGYDSGSAATYGGGPPQESPNQVSPPAGGNSWGGGPTQESPNQWGGPNTMGGPANQTHAPTNIQSAYPGGGGNPLLASLAQQNQENAGNGPNKAWNSTAKNNPWAGMTQDQFRSSMADNVGGSGVGGLENIAGPGWQNAPQVNIPGLTYTGANHELGGNPFIGAAGARAGMTPQQMALWTLQGYKRTQDNPIQGQWNNGVWQQTSGYNMPGTQSTPSTWTNPNSGNPWGNPLSQWHGDSTMPMPSTGPQMPTPTVEGGPTSQGPQPTSSWSKGAPTPPTPWSPPTPNPTPSSGGPTPPTPTTGGGQQGWSGNWWDNPRHGGHGQGNNWWGSKLGFDAAIGATGGGSAGGGSTPPPAGTGTGTGTGTGAGTSGGDPWSTPGGFPWTQAYQGQFTAPLNGTEQGAMGQYQNFINGLGSGTPGSPQNAPTNFANLYTSGPGANSNATMDQIQNAAQGWQNYENQEALRRIGSSAAAGGGALSGANMQAQSDYLNNANNLFNQTMGTMRLQNAQYGQGLQNALLQSQIGAQATMGAAGEQAGANEYGAGLGYQENQQALQNQALQNLFGMGQVGQNTEQNQYNAAYQDWLRQTNNMQNMYTYPDQFGLSQLAYGGYGAGQPNSYGNSTLAQILAQLGVTGTGGDQGILSQILNGYNQGAGTGTTGSTDTGTQFDGTPHYDGGTTNPSLQSITSGRDYWLNRLNQSEASSAAAQNAGQPSAGVQTASGALALLNLLLGGGGTKPGGGVGTSGGGSPGNPTMASGAPSGQGNLGVLGLLAKGVGSLLNPKKPTSPGGPTSATTPTVGAGTGTSTGTDPTTGLPAGASMTTDPSGLLNIGMIDPNNYNLAGQPNVIDPNNSNQDLLNYLNSYPTDYQSTDTSGFNPVENYGDFGGGFSSGGGMNDESGD